MDNVGTVANTVQRITGAARFLQRSVTLILRYGRGSTHESASHDYGGGSVDGTLFYRHQRFVGLIEREGSYFRPQTNLACDLEKISSVSTRHVRDTAKLALAPQQAIVIKLRNAVQVNGVDGDHSSLSQAGESCDYDIATGSESHCTIEFRGRPGAGFPAHGALRRDAGAPGPGRHTGAVQRRRDRSQQYRGGGVRRRTPDRSAEAASRRAGGNHRSSGADRLGAVHRRGAASGRHHASDRQAVVSRRTNPKARVDMAQREVALRFPGLIAHKGQSHDAPGLFHFRPWYCGWCSTTLAIPL